MIVWNFYLQNKQRLIKWCTIKQNVEFIRRIDVKNLFKFFIIFLKWGF